MFGIETKAAN